MGSISLQTFFFFCILENVHSSGKRVHNSTGFSRVQEPEGIAPLNYTLGEWRGVTKAWRHLEKSFRTVASARPREEKSLWCELRKGYYTQQGKIPGDLWDIISVEWDGGEVKKRSVLVWSRNKKEIKAIYADHSSKYHNKRQSKLIPFTRKITYGEP